ncbi:Fc receptor-like protein 6 isoform X2 [Dendropsophus ebraccatus]|uniref:Fc receptor-like protein 6 isoform X2 n=1 Tax=Dendropsophus ebraccatus TaxID=150705 RepID=UPI003831A0D4
MKVDPKTVVEGDVMTLTCDTRPSRYRMTAELKYSFYRDGRKVQEPGSSRKYKVHHVNQELSGNYKCEVSTTNGVKKQSREQYIPVQELFFHPNITTKSNPVVEGDHMILSCNTTLSSHRPTTDLKFAFYRDGEKVQEYNSSNTYGIRSVQAANSGEYSCKVSAANTVTKHSQKKYINVQELFTVPQMQVEPDPVVEGDTMTLTCNVTLSPYRATTELRYTFYRDGRTVQETNSSREYKVQPVKLRDSGNYKCEVSTTNGVKKQSQERHILVKDLFSTPEIHVNPHLVVEGNRMTLTCNASLSRGRKTTDLRYTFYRDGRTVQELGLFTEYKVQPVKPRDSGNYKCAVSTTNGVKKISQEQHILVQESSS